MELNVLKSEARIRKCPLHVLHVSFIDDQHHADRHAANLFGAVQVTIAFEAVGADGLWASAFLPPASPRRSGSFPIGSADTGRGFGIFRFLERRSFRRH